MSRNSGEAFKDHASIGDAYTTGENFNSGSISSEGPRETVDHLSLKEDDSDMIGFGLNSVTDFKKMYAINAPQELEGMQRQQTAKDMTYMKGNEGESVDKGTDLSVLSVSLKIGLERQHTTG